MRVARLGESITPRPANADPDEDLDMPLIPPRQHCTAFLYESFDDAAEDKNFLAMGFFIGMPSEKHKGYFYLHLVTNEHVIQGLKTVCARIHICSDPKERARGRFSEPDDVGALIIPTASFVTDRKTDLAIAIVTLPDDSLVHHTPIDSLITDFRSSRSPDIPFVGVGDEIMMMARIVRRGVHYLKENLQVARFGNVALVPKHEEPFFLTEMRSVGGHSGSPVWVYLPGVESEQGSWRICGTPARVRSFGMMLLGINLGHLRDFEPIVTIGQNHKEKAHASWLSQKHEAISQVVPAWCITDLLYGNELETRRDRADAKHESGADIVKDSIKPLASRK